MWAKLPSMECIALGIGGMMPMPARLTTSVLVRRQGRMMMFDAGEGIQLALKRGGLGIRALDAIAVTHLHADHILGVPGILMFRAQNDDPGPLTIIGPPGVSRFVNNTLEDLKYRINYDIDFIEWSPDKPKHAWSWNNVAVDWEPLEHSTFCLGYRLTEPDRPGKFHEARARALGLQPGPAYSRLQSGIPVETRDGRTVLPEDVMGAPRRGRIVAFCTDTRPCAAVANLCKGADLAFIEGMFASEHEKEAAQKKHMTAIQAATLAQEAGVDTLRLVHISPRYSKDDEGLLEKEAQTVFANTKVAKALQAYPVALPD